jgi:hypothetical protein
MGYTMIFVGLSYMIPLLVATGAKPNAKYCDGCFVSIADDIAGPWLGYWITVSAAISCIGLFIAEMGKIFFILASYLWLSACISLAISF